MPEWLPALFAAAGAAAAEAAFQAAELLGPGLLGHLWVSSLVALPVIALALLWRRASAALRCTLYLLAALKFLLPTGLLATIGGWVVGPLWGAPGSTSGGFGPWTEAVLSWGSLLFDGEALLTSGLQWWDADIGLGLTLPGAVWMALLALWLVPAVVLASLAIGGYQRQLGRLQDAGLEHGLTGRLEGPLEGPLADKAWEPSTLPADLGRRVVTLARCVGLRRAPAVVLSSTFSEPTVVGILRSRLVIPPRLLRALSAADLDAVLLHELVHIARRDNLFAALLLALRCAFWFHPLLWWAESKVRRERERACDERAAELVGDRPRYARSLARALLVGAGIDPHGALEIPRALRPGGLGASSLRGEGGLQGRLARLRAPAVAPRRSCQRLALAAVALFLLVPCLLVPLSASSASQSCRLSAERSCPLDLAEPLVRGALDCSVGVW